MIEIGTGARPSMALELEPQLEQQRVTPITPPALHELIGAGPTWWVRHDGRLVAVAGHFEQWKGRVVLWGFVGADAGPAMTTMTREVRRQLSLIDADRIEAYASCRHRAARRWLKLLGFRQEGVMRKFMPGTDMVMFARTR